MDHLNFSESVDYLMKIKTCIHFLQQIKYPKESLYLSVTLTIPIYRLV